MTKQFENTPKYTYNDYAREISDKFIEMMQDGTAPWLKEWKGADLSSIMPRNATTGNTYKGINTLNLIAEAQIKGYEDPRWLTYKQAKALGGNVKAGEKHTKIEFWQFGREVDKIGENGRPVIGEDGKPEKIFMRYEHPAHTFHQVFNAAQCENIPELVKEDLATKREFIPIEMAEKILQNSGAVINYDKHGRSAHYQPQSDEITLPLKELFSSEMGFYSTALHELGHWSGHDSRLNRDMSHPFGTEGYAKEELRAEIASFMLCSELGVDFDPSNHGAYVKSWCKNLEDEPKEIFRASSDALKITNFIMALSLEKEFEQEVDKTMTPNKERGTMNQNKEQDVSFVESLMSKNLNGEEITRDEYEKTINIYKDDMLRKGFEEYEFHYWDDLKNDSNPHSALMHVRDVLSSNEVVKDFREDVVFKDFQELKDYTKQLESQYPHFAVTHGVSLTNNTLYSNYIMADKDNNTIKTLDITTDGRQVWGIIDAEKAKERFENGYKAYLIKEWGLDQAKESPQKGYPMKENIAVERTVLFVPYKEKDEARLQGARWDKEEKTWYAPVGTNLDNFEKWTIPPPPKDLKPNMSPQEEFKIYLESKGLILEDEPKMDGKLHRVAVEGDKHPGRKNGGAYLAHLDGRPAGFIQNFVTDVKENWKAQSFDQENVVSRIPTPAEIVAQKEANDKKAQARDEELKLKHLEVALKVRTNFKESRDGSENHPYLKEKGVKNHGLKLDERGNLYMPLKDVDDKIWSAQHIGINGYKAFEKGGKKEGNFYTIGEHHNTSKALIVCEGYATGASIHEATGKGVIVAVDAGNLEAVGKVLRERYPDKDILFAADNDIKRELEGKDNVGRLRAEEAAEAVKGVVFYPQLTQSEIKAGMSDFNDVAKSRGLDELRTQITLKMDSILTKGEHSKPMRDLEKHGKDSEKDISLGR